MKTAAVFGLKREQTRSAFQAMVHAQRLRPWHTAAELNCGPGAAAYICTSDQFGRVPLARQAANGNWVVVTGVPIAMSGSLDLALDECLSLPLHQALHRLSELDGAFAALRWDEATRKLGIVTDILGMQPLHVFHEQGVLAVATDSKAITAARLLPARMNAAAWGAFLSMKHPIAGQTLVEGITRAPAGSILILDSDTNKLSSETYWKWPERGNVSLEDAPVRELADVFLAELTAYREHHSQAKLCLSGGYDSRLILAGLAQLGAVPETLSLSHADELFDVDGRIAARMARTYGAAFRMYDSDRSFYSSAAYLDYVIASEVSTPSLYLFIAQLCSTLRPEMQAVWEGVFPGCILFPVHQPPGGFAQYLHRECAPVGSLAWQAAAKVFAPDVLGEMRSGFQTLLQEETSRYTDDEFGVSQFVVRNRTRHRIAINPLQVYANDVIPFTPGISKRFWSLAAAIPYDARSEHRLYQRMFREVFPRSMKVPAVSGSTPYALNSRFDRDYLLARLGLKAAGRPKIATALRLAGLGHSGSYWESAKVVEEALDAFQDFGEELSADSLARIREAHAPFDAVTEKARELLFYWSWWRRIHRGEALEIATAAPKKAG